MNWNGKRILVTGGAGFIGGNIALELLHRGAIVDIMDNFSVGRQQSIPLGVNKIYNSSVTERNLDPLKKNDYNMVFHFAAPCSIILFDKEPLSLYADAIDGTYSIRKFCDETNVPYLVYASSATYYGNTTADWHAGKYEHLNYMEEMPPAPANIYGATKTAEESFDSLFPEIDKLGLRIFPAYGPREYLKGEVASVMYKFASYMMNGQRPQVWGTGNQSRDYLYITDLVNVVLKLIDHRAKGPFNIGSTEVTTTNELVDIINKYLGTNIQPQYIKNPYEESFLDVLSSDITKMSDVIGPYDFISIKRGMSLMMNQMIETGNY